MRNIPCVWHACYRLHGPSALGPDANNRISAAPSVNLVDVGLLAEAVASAFAVMLLQSLLIAISGDTHTTARCDRARGCADRYKMAISAAPCAVMKENSSH